MEPRISVVINTLNEEKNLPNALRSVAGWADEIVVVDMHSDDRTVEIARSFGAVVSFHERIGFADPARAFALAQATGDWILMLDADELVPAPLSEKLREVARSDAADIINLPWLNYIFGAPLLHTGWGPEQDTHMRFFKREALRVDAKMHNFLTPMAGARVFDLPYRPGWAIVHFNYLDTAQFLEKLNRYTSIEARQAWERGERSTPVRALFHAAKTFAGRYLYPHGYRDGWRGWYLSLFMAFYRIAIHAKLTEMEKVGSREAVERRYRQEAEQLLRAYDATSSDDDAAVDLVVNTFERTYRDVLAPGYFPMIEAQQARHFARRVAIIGNVDDQCDARRRAEDLIARGELDAYAVVAEHLDVALRDVGLRRADLDPVAYYSDWALVAVTLSGSPWLLHWDAEARLRTPANWIDPAIRLMEEDRRIFTANPAWQRPATARDTMETRGNFALGYGFSDQVFLARRADLAAPIYRHRCLASLRYPLAHVSHIFEARVDAYMRRHRRLRATYQGAIYTHPHEGESHPRLNTAQALVRARNRLLTALLSRSPFAIPRWRI